MVRGVRGAYGGRAQEGHEPAWLARLRRLLLSTRLSQSPLRLGKRRRDILVAIVGQHRSHVLDARPRQRYRHEQRHRDSDTGTGTGDDMGTQRAP
jgi:hypothetical protein